MIAGEERDQVLVQSLYGPLRMFYVFYSVR